MKLFLRRVHLRIYFAVLLFFFTLGYPFLWFFAKNPQKHFRQIVFLRKWIGALAMLTVGFRVKVTYEEKINWNDGPFLICPNHSSFLDISILNLIVKGEFSYMGKEELLKNIVTKIFFKTIDIPVNRQSKISAFRAFKRANSLLNDGKSVVIFPEGKIDDSYPPRLQEFKSGLFRLATDRNIKIIPIIIHDAWKIYWDDGKKYGTQPGIIHVSILKPIPAKNSSPEKEENDLGSFVREKMLQTWKQRDSDPIATSK